MKRKTKLLASVGLLALSIFGLMMGVYAAVQRQLNITGTISFSASTLRASYVVTKTDAFTGDTVDYSNAVASGSFNDTNNSDQTAALGDITLSDAANKFAYKVVITNNESVRTIEVNYTLPVVTESWLTLYVNDEEVTTTTPITLTSGQSTTVEFMLVADPLTAPTNISTGINLASSFTLSLPDAAEASAQEIRDFSNIERQSQSRNNQKVMQEEVYETEEMQKELVAPRPEPRVKRRPVKQPQPTQTTSEYDYEYYNN